MVPVCILEPWTTWSAGTARPCLEPIWTLTGLTTVPTTPTCLPRNTPGPEAPPSDEDPPKGPITTTICPITPSTTLLTIHPTSLPTPILLTDPTNTTDLPLPTTTFLTPLTTTIATTILLSNGHIQVTTI